MTKKSNKNRFAPKLHIKKGDKVIVVAGANKGTTGEVLEVLPKISRVIVEQGISADTPGNPPSVVIVMSVVRTFQKFGWGWPEAGLGI